MFVMISLFLNFKFCAKKALHTGNLFRKQSLFKRCV